MYTQENRTLRIGTSLGDDVLLLTKFSGTESLSSLFSFDLQLVSEQNHQIVFKDVIGKNVTVSIELPDGEVRYFNGILSTFTQHSSGFEAEGNEFFSSYSATMVPSVWLLSRSANMRIFQEKKVEEIVKEVLEDKGITDFEFKLSRSHYAVREYCVQYRETDLNFISRLLEEEGIYYFFKHENGKHTLVMADNIDANEDIPFQEEVRFHHSTAEHETETFSIRQLETTNEIRVGKYVLKDFDFKKPTNNLLVESKGKSELAAERLEVYDYPAEFCERSVGEEFVHNRIEEEEAQIARMNGESDAPIFSCGYKFKLVDYYREDMNEALHLLTAVNHNAVQPLETRGEKGGWSYANVFSCMPHEVAFRPQRTTVKPVVEGVHTAFVVGPSGEEIHTDEHGRVKVQFHWDRYGKADDNSSCWMRVAQGWAGLKWGSIFIPRIGHEVVVSFIDGDPDRPIVTGSVYNGNNTPPYDLPGEKTKSTIKSNSSKDAEGFNEFRFEDKAGEEQIFLHAQKDYDIRVKNDRKEYVGNERHLTVTADQFEKNEANKHKIIVGDLIEKIDGNLDHTLGGNKTVAINGNMDLSVSGDVNSAFEASNSLYVGSDEYKEVGSNLSLKAGSDIMLKAGMKFAFESGTDMHLKAGTNLVLEAGVQLSLKVGGNIIDIGSTGVTVKGTNVFLDGSATVVVKGGAVNINTGGGGGSAASGCGCSPTLPVKPETPEEPTEPILPGEAEAGSAGDVEPPAEQLAKAAAIPQVKVLKQGGQSGAAVCEA